MSADLAPHGAELVATVPHFVVIPPPEPDDLTWHQADELTGRIRRALRDLAAAVDDFTALVERAWASRADIALGYPSWADYCGDIFADVRGIRLPAPTRQAVVLALRTSGMSTRAMASAVGIDKKTVMADLRLVRSGPVETPETVTSLDGRRRPATTQAKPPAPQRTKTATTIELLEAAGETGLTWAELGQRMRWHHGIASATLTRLHQQGRITRTEERRTGSAVYASLPAQPREADAYAGQLP